jgi:hypothetical protein
LIDDGETRLHQYLLDEGVAVSRQPLGVFDLQWYGEDGSEVHLGERKTAADLIASITDDRLLDECQRAHDIWGAHLWLFVSGLIVPVSTGVKALFGKYQVRGEGVTWQQSRDYAMPFQRVQTHLLELEAWCGVRVVSSLDDRELARQVAKLWRRRATPPTPRLWRPGVQLMKRNPVAAAYLTYDGVGEQTAMKLSGRFPREYELAGAADEEVLAVEGVGEKRLAAIRKRLNGT